MALEIIQMTLPQSKYNIKCPYAMPNPSRVVVHNTASDASAKSEISYMQGNGYEVSYHYAVDDVRAVQGLPLNRTVGMLVTVKEQVIDKVLAWKSVIQNLVEIDLSRLRKMALY